MTLPTSPVKVYLLLVRLRPTLRANHLSWAGLVCVLGGLARSSSDVVAYGCALMLGVAISKALTRVSVSRARSAGFEMLWLGATSTVKATRLEPTVIVAELRNRDTLATHFKGLCVTHAPGLLVHVEPDKGTIPPGGKLDISLHVRPLRVGFHGIYSLTLSTIRAPGLFTVPLAFSNPYVIEVLPRTMRLGPSATASGRSVQPNARVNWSPRQGESLEVRELREHQAGDPYRRIAWKASARRGRLMVIDREQERSDTVWLIVDLSIDSASGEVGSTAMDRGIDLAAQLVQTHLKRGDAVGLAMVGARILKLVSPAHGNAQAARLISTLTHYAHTADQDRSAWDQADVSQKVLEHARSLNRDLANVSSSDDERLWSAAAALMKRAPAHADHCWSTNIAEQTLRNYLLSFGIQPPPRAKSDRFQTELQMARLIRDLLARKRSCSGISLIARPPGLDSPKQLLDVLGLCSRRRVQVSYYPMLDYAGQRATNRKTPQARIAEDAILHRQRLAAEDGLVQLRRLGVHIPRVHELTKLSRQAAQELLSYNGFD